MKKLLNKKANELFEECKDGYRLVSIAGNENVNLKEIAGYEECGPGDLVFVSDVKKIAEVIARKPSGIVVPEAEAVKISENNDMAVFASSNTGVSYALLRQKYTDRDYNASGWPRIHPSAIIHETVTIPENTIIGPNVVIEKNAKIGENCVLQANVVIEHDAIVGDGTVIQPGSILSFGCILGKNCLVLPNSIIGSEGFGYSQDENFNHYRIPQTGNVVIGDKVVIGALNAIDRATYKSTIFDDGVICDNICHTAHNVKVGKNSILLTGWKCAGSSEIGSRVIASGDTMVKDHVKICDDTIFVHRAGIITDITEKGMYAGSPTQPMREYVKNLSVLTKLGDLQKEVKELKKALLAKQS